MTNGRGTVHKMRIAVRYPNGQEKITIWPWRELADVGSLVLMPEIMTPPQLKLFRVGPDWQRNPTFIKRDRAGRDTAICAWEQQRHSRLKRLVTHSDPKRGSIQQLDIEVHYPDGSQQFKSYDKSWIGQTAELILYPLDAIPASPNWKRNPALIRRLADRTVEGLCAKIIVQPPQSPAPPANANGDCGFGQLLRESMR